jgi:O-antigen/teichoic acid export membrane protein
VSNVRRHFKNAASLLMSGAMAKVVMFLASVRIFKALTVEDNGVFQLALSYGFIFSVLSELGVRGYAVRELAKLRTEHGRAQALFGDIINVRIVLTVLVVPLSFAILWAAGYSRNVVAVSGWFLLYALLDSFALLFKFVLRAYERMEFDAVFSVIGRGLILILVLAFGFAGRIDLFTVTLSHLVAASVECVGLIIAIKIVTRLKLFGRMDTSGMKDVLWRSMPFAVTGVLGILYLRTGTIALSKLLGAQGETAVSYFNTAARLPEALYFLPMAVVNALVPYLSRNYADVPLVRRYLTFIMRYTALAGLALTALFVFETQWLILTIAKKDYLVAAPTFRWYGVWLPLCFVHYAVNNVLICINEEVRVMQLFGLSLLANVVLNLVLIPSFGVTGAGAALAFSELTGVVLSMLILWRRGIRLPVGLLVQVTVFAVLMAALCWAVIGWPTPVRLLLEFGGAGLFSLAVFLREDRHLLGRLLSRPAPAP